MEESQSSNGYLVLFQTLEKIEDMAVSLIREEWLLDPSQKDLSRDNRPENFRNVFSLGKENCGYYCHFRFFVCLLFMYIVATAFLKDIVEFKLRIQWRDIMFRLLEILDETSVLLSRTSLYFVLGYWHVCQLEIDISQVLSEFIYFFSKLSWDSYIDFSHIN